jgi:hypothetical protein
MDWAQITIIRANMSSAHIEIKIESDSMAGEMNSVSTN